MHRSSDVERRATLTSSTSSMKERLAGTPFMHLSVSHTLIKTTLDKVSDSSYESCLNMACSGTHVRLKILFLSFFFYFITFVYSSEFQLEDGVLQIVVQSEKNGNPAKGPTSYKVKVEHTPGARRGGRGRKNKLNLDWTFSCECPCFEKQPTLCKHIGACAIVHFH